jgi:polar amino acid transport system permease protein
MRAIPLLVVLVWGFFAFPLLTGHSVNAVTTASPAQHPSRRLCEARPCAPATSVRRNQMQAASPLGMSRFEAFRTIICRRR